MRQAEARPTRMWEVSEMQEQFQTDPQKRDAGWEVLVYVGQNSF